MAVLGETGRKVIERVSGKGWLGGKEEEEEEARGWCWREWPLSFENYRREWKRQGQNEREYVRARKDERERERKSVLEVMDKSWKRRVVMGKKMAFVPRV